METHTYLAQCYSVIEEQSLDYYTPLKVSLAEVEAYLATLDAAEDLLWPNVFHNLQGVVVLHWIAHPLVLRVEFYGDGFKSFFYDGFASPRAAYKHLKTLARPEWKSFFTKDLGEEDGW